MGMRRLGRTLRILRILIQSASTVYGCGGYQGLGTKISRTVGRHEICSQMINRGSGVKIDLTLRISQGMEIRKLFGRALS